MAAKRCGKKQKTDIVVGDFVEISDDGCYIVKRLKRTNSILRPKAANIDIALVVTSFKEPDLDYIQLNRYLIYLKYNKINAAICINKEDLEDNLSFRTNEIIRIYKNLGYKIFFISAKGGNGIADIKKFISNKTVVLCGQSGVGKTTMINALIPNYMSKINSVSLKTQRGRHSTRHCEIARNENYKIIDTPGFSCLKFDFILPEELIELFDDIKIYGANCKYVNCMHNTDKVSGCCVLNNIDKIESSRYQSYLEFLKETEKYKAEISKKGIKKESAFKNSGNILLTKISKRKRNSSRRVQKQKSEMYNE